LGGGTNRVILASSTIQKKICQGKIAACLLEVHGWLALGPGDSGFSATRGRSFFEGFPFPAKESGENLAQGIIAGEKGSPSEIPPGQTRPVEESKHGRFLDLNARIWLNKKN